MFLCINQPNYSACGGIWYTYFCYCTFILQAWTCPVKSCASLIWTKANESRRRLGRIERRFVLFIGDIKSSRFTPSLTTVSLTLTCNLHLTYFSDHSSDILSFCSMKCTFFYSFSNCFALVEVAKVLEPIPDSDKRRGTPSPSQGWHTDKKPIHAHIHI